MRILVADDEKLVRYTLKSMLEEIDIPDLSILMARDGEEMVERIGSARPDLAFVDIKMPKLNGLQAMERARVLSPHTKWIVLTSYSSFEYAKKAIGLGAEDYLLKPVSPAELAQVIRKIAGKSRQDWLRLNEEFEAHLSALLHNTLILDQDSAEFLAGAIYAGALLVFDSSLAAGELVDQQRSLCSLIRRELPSAISEARRAALCALPAGQLALVGAWQPGIRSGEDGQAIRFFFRKVHSLACSAAPKTVCLSQLLSEDCRSFPEFLDQLDLLSRLAPLRVASGIGAQLPLQALRERAQCEPQLHFCRDLIGLGEAWRGRNRLEFLRLSEEVEKSWKAWRPAARELTCRRVRRFLEAALGLRFAERPGSDGWLPELREQADRLLNGRPAGRCAGLVDQVVQFVQDNYMHNIGIRQIAGDLGITPNYLSHLFRKHTGTTFIKYITRLRMSKARQMLADPASQVHQVARQVGYFSTRHFSKLFRQQFGHNPSDIRGDSAKPALKS